MEGASENKEFKRVMNILTRDEELKPLIFEHEQILTALRDIHDIRAE